MKTVINSDKFGLDQSFQEILYYCTELTTGLMTDLVGLLKKYIISN